jgi:acyl transferase domain-containing protein
MKTAVVVCPGRGVYNKSELGYLARHHADKSDLFQRFDRERRRLGQATLAELDGAKAYSNAIHTRGDNASALIFAATLADLLSIDKKAIEVVAVTGNSMGWYSALACAGALSPEAGFQVANTMGALMQESLIGGQMIYPFVGEDWSPAPDRKASLLALVGEIARRPGCELALSIDLGGMLVVGGDEAGLAAFAASVPPTQGRFPLRLANHAAFHTRLQSPVAAKGRERLALELFASPRLPLVDGRGAIWQPQATPTQALWDYTLGRQVVETYDFTKAIQVAAREFAPDVFIVTGPGATLGGAVAQALILADWRGMKSKNDFQDAQRTAPVLIAMGMEDQRREVVGPVG